MMANNKKEEDWKSVINFQKERIGVNTNQTLDQHQPNKGYAITYGPLKWRICFFADVQTNLTSHDDITLGGGSRSASWPPCCVDGLWVANFFRSDQQQEEEEVEGTVAIGPNRPIAGLGLKGLGVESLVPNKNTRTTNKHNKRSFQLTTASHWSILRVLSKVNQKVLDDHCSGGSVSDSGLEALSLLLFLGEIQK